MAALYFRTYTGKHVHPLSPRPEEIDIEDVARSLSHICRFLGHVDKFYSVAQHAVLVSRHVPPEDALWGLLHDASEAYLCDLPAPIKRDPQMEIYRLAEGRLMAAVCEKFGLASRMPRSVMIADKVLLATEFRDVTTVADDLDWIITECGSKPLEDCHIFPWPPAAAEDQFLRRFWELTR
jgi:5'-deoxynucleotidase YfbR-like HD superfamily hydrolase